MRLLPTEIMSGAPVRSRDISLGDDPGINGQLWDVNRIDITAQQGTWERWTVRADMPQSFHIEGVSFLIRNVNASVADGDHERRACPQSGHQSWRRSGD
nr:hypothetical protein A9Y87_13445 [Salmonella enterica subsp. enterica]